MGEIVICGKVGTTHYCKGCPYSRPFVKKTTFSCEFEVNAYQVTKTKMTLKEIKGGKLVFTKKGINVGEFTQYINESDETIKDMVGKVVWVWLEKPISILRIAKY